MAAIVADGFGNVAADVPLRGDDRTLPLPDFALMHRVGSVPSAEAYLELGRSLALGLRSALPPEWTFEGKNVLDFGSGAGRVLRHFLEPAAQAQSFVAADPDKRSIDWLREHLIPPFQAVQSGELPPLPFPDDTFDLVYGLSVFTHLPDSWWQWLHELHRISRPGAYVLLTYQGRQAFRNWFDGAYDPDDVGIVGVHDGVPWDLGGAVVFHSERWIRAVWSSVFEIEGIVPGREGGAHDLAVLRTRRRPARSLEDGPPTLPAGDELRSLRLNLCLVRDEIRLLRHGPDSAELPIGGHGAEGHDAGPVSRTRDRAQRLLRRLLLRRTGR